MGIGHPRRKIGWLGPGAASLAGPSALEQFHEGFDRELDDQRDGCIVTTGSRTSEGLFGLANENLAPDQYRPHSWSKPPIANTDSVARQEQPKFFSSAMASPSQPCQAGRSRWSTGMGIRRWLPMAAPKQATWPTGWPTKGSMRFT